MDHYTMMDHAYPHCSSRETYRGVLDGPRAESSTGVSS